MRQGDGAGSKFGSPRVIVVGAGIAGLTAAHVLTKAGAQVTVLEATDRVGGRMSTDRHDGFVIDRGAQFMSSEYQLLRSIAGELNLSGEVVEACPWTAVIRQKKVRRVRSDNPLHALTSGLLEPTVWTRLGWRNWQLRRSLSSLSLSDYSQWSAFDTEPVSVWATQELGSTAVEYLFEPMLHGFYFQTPEETSRALALALMGFGWRRSRTLSFANGMGALPEAMAKRLEVVLNSPVIALEVANHGVHVATDTTAMNADFCILAVPATQALQLHPDRDENALRVMTTRYSSSINIALMASGEFRLPADLVNVYGLLIPRRDRRYIAGIGIEANKGRHIRHGHLLNVMLANEAARALMTLPDQSVIDATLTEAEKYFPGLAARVEWARVYRWPEAEPCSPVGRARNLRHYRERCRYQAQPVLLAGDYMSMPYTEGAAESGKWASETILGWVAGHPLTPSPRNPDELFGRENQAAKP